MPQVNQLASTPYFATLAFAAMLYQCVISSSHAEILSLGPFSPETTVYGVALDPIVDISADVTTNKDGAYAAMNGYVSIDTTTLSEKLNALARNLLPLIVQAKPCDLEIQSASSIALSVISNTGDFHTTTFVVPHGCALTSGEVSLSLRFVPLVTRSSVSLKITKIDVTVPFEWKFVGFFAGKSPQNLIAQQITSMLGKVNLTMPSIEHVKAAFQGASLDTKGKFIVARIRFDALIDQPAIMDALNRSDQIRNLSFTYP